MAQPYFSSSQTVATFPPWPAGGDLQGTYPNPTINPAALPWMATATTLTPTDPTKIVTVPGDPTVGSTVSLGAGGAAVAKGRLQSQSSANPGQIGIFSNRNWLSGNTQDDPSKPSWALQLGPAGDNCTIQRSPAGSTTQTTLAYFYAPGDFQITGSIATKTTGTAWVNPSDVRLKKNIQPYTRGLDAILALAPKTFEFNGKGGSHDGLAAIGLIADDVQDIMPEMVGTSPVTLAPEDTEATEILTLDTTALQLALVNAVKELAARVAALEGAR